MCSGATLQQFDKFHVGAFGRCPRVYCQGQNVLPAGLSDVPRNCTVAVYCPKCQVFFCFLHCRRQVNAHGSCLYCADVLWKSGLLCLTELCSLVEEHLDIAVHVFVIHSWLQSSTATLTSNVREIISTRFRSEFSVSLWLGHPNLPLRLSRQLQLDTKYALKFIIMSASYTTGFWLM